MFSMPLLLIFLFFLIASWIVSSQLKKRFKKYSKTPLDSNLSGAEVAQKMLRDNGINDVRVLPSKGHLTDHYNPANKTVNLSENVYHGRNVAAASVAAHECGHAVQHARAYAPLKLRTVLVPVQNMSAKVLNAIFMMMIFGAFILPSIIPFNLSLQVIIACYAVFTAVAFITLPVEINATQRALVWLHSANITSGRNHNQARDALKWAAYTYVVAALSALATLAYYVMLFLGTRD